MNTWFVYLMTFASSLMFWSLTEYFVHNVLCHKRKSKIANKIHWDHHRQIGGIEKARLEASAYGKATSLYIAAIATPILWFFFQLIMGQALGFIFAAGFVVGYLHYEYVHWRIHCRAPRNRHELKLRQHHFAHHYCNPKRYQSVTMPALDHFFGTLPDPKTQAEHFEKIEPKEPLNSEGNLWSWIHGLSTRYRFADLAPYEPNKAKSST